MMVGVWDGDENEGVDDGYASEEGLSVISPAGDGALAGPLVKFKFRYTTPLQVAKNKQFFGFRQKLSICTI